VTRLLSRRLTQFAAALAAAICLAACTSYQPGAAPPPPFRSLGIAPVSVQAYAPQSGPLLHRHLASVFLRTPGDLRITTPASAEAILEVVLVGYDRRLRTTRSDDTGLGRSFDITVTAEVTLRSADGSIRWLDAESVSVSDPAYAAGPLAQAEEQLLPALAERLAQRIRDQVLLRF